MDGQQAPLQKDIAEALGLSAAQVTRAKARGMPVHLGIDACLQWRDANVRKRVEVGQAMRPSVRSPARGRAVEGAYGQPFMESPPGPDGIDFDQVPDYQIERARREAAEARLAEFKLLELRGVLVRADEVRSAHARQVATLREALLQLPARLAPVVAAEADLARCNAAIEDELHAVLALVTGH